MLYIVYDVTSFKTKHLDQTHLSQKHLKFKFSKYPFKFVLIKKKQLEQNGSQLRKRPKLWALIEASTEKPETK